MVEGARLESGYRVSPYRGFESRPVRHLIKQVPCGPFLLNGDCVEFETESGFDKELNEQSGFSVCNFNRKQSDRIKVIPP